MSTYDSNGLRYNEFKWKKNIHHDKTLAMVDAWLEKTKSSKDEEYKQAFKESDTIQNLLNELDDEE